MGDTGITRIYQFLSNYNKYDGDWKTDADKNGDGTLIKAEVYTFLANNSSEWRQEGDNERDIINKFWQSIDSNVSGKVKAGSNINNKNSLDDNEIKMAEKMIEMTKTVKSYIEKYDFSGVPTNIRNNASWRNNVISGVLEKALDYYKNNPNADSLSEEQLDGFVNQTYKKSTADYYFDELKKTIGDGLKDESGQTIYKCDSDDILKKIKSRYLNSMDNTSGKSIQDILDEVQALIDAYKDTANTNTHTDLLDVYGYNASTAKLNDLQKETLKKEFSDKIKEYLTTNSDMKDVYTDEYKSQIDTLIQNYITSYLKDKYASEFTSLKNGFKVDDFIKSTEFAKLASDIREGIATRAQTEKEETEKTNYTSLADLIANIKEENLHIMANGIAEIHTEFGMNSSGDIVFEQTDTKTVYENMKKMLKDELQKLQPEAYNAIISYVDKLIQSAWIMTYNDYASSSKWNTSSFISKVLDNFESILNKLKTNPEYLSVFAADHTAYANSNLTKDLKYYNKKVDDGNDSVWVYSGSCSIDKNGAITWDDKADAAEYNEEMTLLLKKIKSTEPYKNIDPSVITDVFRDAQQQAINACKNNKQDCPYGTTTDVDLDIYHGGWLHTGSKHFDVNSHTMNATSGQDWSGTSREDDDHHISIRALVEMTLYYFDKLLYKKLAE